MTLGKHTIVHCFTQKSSVLLFFCQYCLSSIPQTELSNRAVHLRFLLLDILTFACVAPTLLYSAVCVDPLPGAPSNGSALKTDDFVIDVTACIKG